MTSRGSGGARFAVVAVLLGVVAGLVWAFVVSVPQARMLADRSAIVPGAQVDSYFGGVGLFVVIMAVVGLVLGPLSWWLAREHRGAGGAVLTAVGASAAGVVAILLGTWVLELRLPDRAHVAVGDTFGVVPNLWLTAREVGAVSAPGLVLIVAPLIALLGYLICILMAKSADLGTAGEARAVVSDAASTGHHSSTG